MDNASPSCSCQGPVEFYKKFWQNYVKFDGTASRPEFWWPVLFNCIISCALGMIGGVLGHGAILSDIFGLAILLPNIGITIRRLHDTGRSGWWFLIVFVPIVGWIALLILCALESKGGAQA